MPDWTIVAKVGQYWKEIAIRAIWDSLLFFFETRSGVWRGISTILLGMAVTTVIVRIARKKEAFTEHLKANVAIVIAGGLATWVLVFICCFIAEPFMQHDLEASEIATSKTSERSADLLKNGDGKTIEQQSQEIVDLKKRLESCPKCAGVGRPASLHVGPNAALIERGRDLLKRINPLLDEWRRNRNSSQPDMVNLTLMHLHPRFLNCCYDDAIKFRADALGRLGRTGNRQMLEEYAQFTSEKSPFDMAMDPTLIEDMMGEIQGLIADLEVKDELN
jgi:hypothetical protein